MTMDEGAANAEAVYITAMFAFFNRVDDAFGISPQGYLEMNVVTK